MSAVVARSERRGRGGLDRTRRLLVLDDDAWCRAIANGALCAQGHRVVSLGTSENVVGIARGMMPDLVLADVTLPHLGLAPLRDFRRTDATHAERFPRIPNGYAILRALDDDSVLVHRVVVLLKERPESTDPADALRFGVVDYVVKPFVPRALVEKVESVLALLPRGPEAPRPAARSWDEPAMDGHVEFVGVPAILEMLHLNQLSGVVTFKAANLSAEVVFRDGEIDAAVMSCGLEGEAALYKLLTWTTGRFVFVPKQAPPRRRVALPFEQILLEGLRRLDESRRGGFTQSLRAVAEPPPFFPSRES